VPGRASTAFQYSFTRQDLLLIQVILRSPASREVAQVVIGAAWEVPACSRGLLDGEWLLCVVRNDCGTTYYSCGVINDIMKLYEDIAGNILEDNDETIFAGCLRDIVEN
jgi:hypothetical protein